MKTLIVPIDFSEASINAANYALEFARVAECSISLIHVCQPVMAYADVPVASIILPEMIEHAKEELGKIRNQLLLQTTKPVKIYTEVREGDIISQLDEYSRALNPYAIVMGARGAGVIERTLFGSTTLSAMRDLQWPLIIVPANASFKNINKIGLATDLKDVVETVHVDAIRQIVKDFGAELHVLHVYTGTSGVSVAEEVQESTWLREMLEGSQPIFHFFNDEDIDVAIGQFAEKIDLDLLMIFPKKHGMFDRILHKSQSRNLALHSSIPLLSIHE